VNWYLIGYMFVGGWFAYGVLQTFGDEPGDELYLRNRWALFLVVAASVLFWPIYVVAAFVRGPQR
jgi:hypothetical protein